MGVIMELEEIFAEVIAVHTPYTPEVIDHFSNPRNVGVIEDADGIGTIGDPDCGDFVRIYLRIRADHIREIAFEACGCPASIATTSALTELAEGKSINEALAIRESDVLEALGGLPEAKVHCSNLGTAALQQAIVYFLQQKKNRGGYDYNPVR